MQRTLFLKPAAGLTVRDPATKQQLAEEGEAKPATAYWLRRVKDQDVLEAEPPVALPVEKSKTKASAAANNDGGTP
jgi:hypothetical protein